MKSLSTLSLSLGPLLAGVGAISIGSTPLFAEPELPPPVLRILEASKDLPEEIPAPVLEALPEPGHQPIPEPEPEPVVLAAVGDLLLHRALQKRAAREGDFSVLFSEVLPLFAQSDLVFGNLEGAMAEGLLPRGKRVEPPPQKLYDGKVYSSYPRFNYHPQLAQDLARSNFSVLSTANNHSLDRDARGVEKTLDALRAQGLSGVGTRKAGEPWEASMTRREVRGQSFAFLGCTEHTNGLKDHEDLVLNCFQAEDRQVLLSLIAQARAQVDWVIVSLHWGKEYASQPTKDQRHFAQGLIEAGVDLVLGGHPHVIQTVEGFASKKNSRQGVIAYSLGNFVSNQIGFERRATMVLEVSFPASKEPLAPEHVRAYPAYMVKPKGVSTELIWSKPGEPATEHLKKFLPASMVELYPTDLETAMRDPG